MTELYTMGSFLVEWGLFTNNHTALPLHHMAYHFQMWTNPLTTAQFPDPNFRECIPLCVCVCVSALPNPGTLEHAQHALCVHLHPSMSQQRGFRSWITLSQIWSFSMIVCYLDCEFIMTIFARASSFVLSAHHKCVTGYQLYVHPFSSCRMNWNNFSLVAKIVRSVAKTRVIWIVLCKSHFRTNYESPHELDVCVNRTSHPSPFKLMGFCLSRSLYLLVESTFFFHVLVLWHLLSTLPLVCHWCHCSWYSFLLYYCVHHLIRSGTNPRFSATKISRFYIFLKGPVYWPQLNFDSSCLYPTRSVQLLGLAINSPLCWSSFVLTFTLS